MNEHRTRADADTALTQPCSLPVLINALARVRRDHPSPHLVTTLIEQCKRFDSNPDAMRPMILKTIERIEAAYSGRRSDEMAKVAKMRHCFNCGAELGVYADYDRMDDCGKRECARAAQDCYAEEREEAHARLDRDMGWD